MQCRSCQQARLLRARESGVRSTPAHSRRSQATQAFADHACWLTPPLPLPQPLRASRRACLPGRAQAALAAERARSAAAEARAAEEARCAAAATGAAASAAELRAALARAQKARPARPAARNRGLSAAALGAAASCCGAAAAGGVLGAA